MSDDMANATRDKWGHKVSIYLKRTQLFSRVSCSIDIEENAMIKKITPYLLCFASKHSAVKLLSAAAKSNSIISVFGFQTVENLFALYSRISYSLQILLDAQLTT